jgi:hypothetical protein
LKRKKESFLVAGFTSLFSAAKKKVQCSVILLFPIRQRREAMDREGLINVCQAATHGSDRFVKNARDNREGKVISCSDAGIEVQVGAQREMWGFNEAMPIIAPTVRSA